VVLAASWEGPWDSFDSKLGKQLDASLHVGSITTGTLLPSLDDAHASFKVGRVDYSDAELRLAEQSLTSECSAE